MFAFFGFLAYNRKKNEEIHKVKKKTSRMTYTGERALFMSRDLCLEECVFEDGESPLKESKNLILSGCIFKWKYPLWYCGNVKLDGCVFESTARAGIWYTENLDLKGGIILAPKTFRRAKNLSIEDVSMTDARETLWNCYGVKLKNVFAKGDYFAMNSVSVEADGLTLDGNYAFDGAKNVVIRSSRMMTKDAFWNCENVTVIDSYVSGEYFGWNSKNVTLINCTVESLQGMCYMDNLVMKNCKLVNTTLAFEYSSVDADIVGKIDGVFNPSSGRITADEITLLTVDRDKVDPDKTVIVCRGK